MDLLVNAGAGYGDSPAYLRLVREGHRVNVDGNLPRGKLLPALVANSS